jgi:integrase
MAGLEPGFRAEAVHAWLHDMVERGVKAATIHTRLATLQLFARCFDLPFPFADELSFWWAMRRRQPTRAAAALERTAIADGDYVNEAIRVLASAPGIASARFRLLAYNKAGMFAIVSECPLRRSDLAALVLGRSIWRADGLWWMSVVQIKTGVRSDVRLAESVTALLDAALLRGAPAEQLDWVYRRRTGQPFFATLDGTPISRGAVTGLFIRHFGAGPHIARYVIYDRLAENPRGIEEAALRCGHVCAGMAVLYSPRSSWRRRSRAAHDRRQNILHRIGLIGRRPRPDGKGHS